MATSNEKQVQLKRETLLNDEAVLEEVFPKTMTDAVIDTNSGVKLSEVIDTILTAINNKVSRNVNSVNGRSGVVLLDASDVGLGNVDNVSTADIKAWIINYIADQFHGKRLILRDYFSQIQPLIDSNNDEYDGVPFVCEHLDESNPNDQTMVIGCIYKESDRLLEEHKAFDFGGGTGVGRIEYDQNNQPLGEYFNIYEEPNRNQALGLYSTAKGYKNITEGQASMVDGSENRIRNHGTNSFETGTSNDCDGANTIVCGQGNTITSNGINSLLGGANNTLAGAQSIVCGGANTVQHHGAQSIVAGSNNTVSADKSIVSGYGNNVSHEGGDESSSIYCGSYNDCTQTKRSIVVGIHNTMNTIEDTIVSGYYNKSYGCHDSIICGLLTNSQNHQVIVSGMQTVASGNRTSVFGIKTEGNGENSFIIGESSNGFNPETLPNNSVRYQGVLNMTVREMITTHKDTPFSIAYGANSFVAGKDNLGLGISSFTIGEKNINQSETSFVCGKNNRTYDAEGIVVMGTNNDICGKWSQGSGIRNCTSGHVATVLGAFNNAENYTTAVGIGSSAEYDYPNSNDDSYSDLDLYFPSSVSTEQAEAPTPQSYIIREETYIELPLPLIFSPIRVRNMIIRIEYAGNVWAQNTLTEKYIDQTQSSEFMLWRYDRKVLYISRKALNEQFGFVHSHEQSAEDLDLEVVDLRDADISLRLTFDPNPAEKIGRHAFKVGNGPFADAIYRDDVWRANAFEVHWDGTTLTQKDIQLRYKIDPNTLDPPVNISFKKVIDALISSGAINLNDILA